MSPPPFQPQIVGDDVVPVGTKSYVVGLRETANAANHCGGTLITPRHVLTTAHCASRRSAHTFSKGHTDGERIEMATTVLHPRFNELTLSFDVAVLTLARAAPVAIYNGTVADLAGKKATAMGWGQISDEADPSNGLLRVEMKIWSTTKCQGAKLSRAPDATMVCAGGKRWQDTCQGDSSGPRVLETKARDVVVGVTSWGDGCGVKGRPSMFAQVSAAADFVRKNASGVTFA